MTENTDKLLKILGFPVIVIGIISAIFFNIIIGIILIVIGFILPAVYTIWGNYY